MLSTVQQAAAPAVGAASQRLRETLARLDAALVRPAASHSSHPAAPAAVPPPIPKSQAAYFELCRAQSAKYDADQAFWEVRDHYHGPGRKQRKAAARLAQEAARARYATAAQAYHASPRGRAEAAARAAYHARQGTAQ
ncbi:MAG: hypothetical protein ACRYFR_14545 [Janthinobacterium lividum]